MSDSPMFPTEPTLRLYDPLGELMGAGGGLFDYCFDDVVKLSGHACPTVAGGFLLVKRALELLYGDEQAQRGDIKVTVYGREDQGSLGPLTQVITQLTGAAAENGFQGLAGQYVRQGLMRFDDRNPQLSGRFRFESLSSGKQVTLVYDASSIAGSPSMGEDLGAILSGVADEAIRDRFRDAWRERVLRILQDQGEHTVFVMDEG